MRLRFIWFIPFIAFSCRSDHTPLVGENGSADSQVFSSNLGQNSFCREDKDPRINLNIRWNSPTPSVDEGLFSWTKGQYTLRMYGCDSLTDDVEQCELVSETEQRYKDVKDIKWSIPNLLTANCRLGFIYPVGDFAKYDWLKVQLVEKDFFDPDDLAPYQVNLSLQEFFDFGFLTVSQGEARVELSLSRVKDDGTASLRNED